MPNKFPIIFKWTIPFPNLRLLSGIFYLNSQFDSVLVAKTASWLKADASTCVLVSTLNFDTKLFEILPLSRVLFETRVWASLNADKSTYITIR